MCFFVSFLLFLTVVDFDAEGSDLQAEGPNSHWRESSSEQEHVDRLVVSRRVVAEEEMWRCISELWPLGCLNLLRLDSAAFF